MLRAVAIAATATLVASAAQAQPPDRCRPSAVDRDRLDRTSQAWDAALADVRAAGRLAELRRLGPALQRKALAGRPEPSPAGYLCRTIKLGAANPGGLPLVAYGWFRCRVTLDAGGDLALVKTTGSQRPAGQICPLEGHGPRRAYFLGTMALGDERLAPPYGAERDRDLVGVVERTGPERWRVVFPWPAVESKLDILELKPAP